MSLILPTAERCILAMQQSWSKTYFKIDQDTLDLSMRTLSNAPDKDVNHIFEAVKENVTQLQDIDVKE